jgi:hypothetical protein
MRGGELKKALLHFFRQHHYPLSMPILGSIVVAPTRILSYFTMSFGSHSGLLIASTTHPHAGNRATRIFDGSTGKRQSSSSSMSSNTTFVLGAAGGPTAKPK